VLSAMVAVSAHWLLSRSHGAAAAVPEPLVSEYIAGLVALASWTQYYPITTGSHCFWGVAPSIGIFTAFVLRLARGRVLAVTLTLSALAMPLILQQSATAIGKLRQPLVTIRNNPVLSGMKLSADANTRWTPLLAALDRYLAEHPQTAILAYGDQTIFAALAPDLRNPSKFWLYDRFYPVPQPEEVLARRREFIREHRPLAVFSWHDPELPESPDRWSMERYDKRIRANRDIKANMEEVIHDCHYGELARAGGTGYTIILLGPGLGRE
jgi:hypothetical protein